MEQKKPWYRRWWAISLYVLFILIYFSLIGEDSAEKSVTKKEYVNEPLSEIYQKFRSVSSPYTDLQKEDLWNRMYKGKYVKGELYARDIDRDFFDGLLVKASILELPIGSEFHILFKENEKDSLLKLSNGAKIIFEGKLEDYDYWGDIKIIDAILL